MSNGKVHPKTDIFMRVHVGNAGKHDKGDHMTFADQSDWPKERVGGWAPGMYSCRCQECRAEYMGDKRSWSCYPCAKKFADDAIDELLAHIDTLEQTAAERVIARGAAVKPHTFAEIVNQVRDIANQYAGTDQLREQIAYALTPHFERNGGPTPDYTGKGSAWVPPVEKRETKDPWESSKLDYDRSIHSNRDAKAWADFFVTTYPRLADKHDIMLGWFANAMMAMHDSLKQEASAVVVPEYPENDFAIRESIRNAGGDPDFDQCVHRAGWFDLSSRVRAIPADRVLGDGEIKGTPEELAKIAEEAGWKWIRTPIESKKTLVDWMADALRANQGGAVT